MAKEGSLIFEPHYLAIPTKIKAAIIVVVVVLVVGLHLQKYYLFVMHSLK